MYKDDTTKRRHATKLMLNRNYDAMEKSNHSKIGFHFKHRPYINRKDGNKNE